MIKNSTRIENEIFWEGLTGRWEKESLKLWIKLCENSKTIFDIGANTGVYSLVARTVNPDSNILAFEPHPKFFQILEKNIAINNYEISANMKAISNVNGKLTIEDYAGSTTEIVVESITLDSWIKFHSLSSVDLLKIDVETLEPLVLDGFKSSLAKHKPTLLIEILNEQVAESIGNQVSGLGYLYFNIDERGSIRQTKTVEKSDFYNYLICQESVAKMIDVLKQ